MLRHIGKFYVGSPLMGIPVFLHWSFFLAILLTLVFKPLFCTYFLISSFIVLLHEYGHCYAARKYAVPTKEILITAVGGIAYIENGTKTPYEEFAVSLAGPMVNMLLVPLTTWHPVLFALNAIILIFNMIPAFPLDGGRVLRSLLAMVFCHKLATKIACGISLFLCTLFLLVGFWFRAFGLVAIGLLGCGWIMAELERIKVENVYTGV